MLFRLCGRRATRTCASVNLRFVNLRFVIRLRGTCVAMCVPTQNARLGYHFQPPSRTKTIEKIIAVLAAAHHALASAAADRASHWAAMPNHQPSCFARSKLPCVAQAHYSVRNQLRLDAVTGVAMPSRGTYAKQTVENACVFKRDTVLYM